MTTPETAIKIQIALAEAQQAQARAAHFNMRIACGIYKTRALYHGHTNRDEERLTEAELLAHEVETADRHIKRAQDCLDYAKELLADDQ